MQSRSQIIATIGPASRTKGILARMIKVGMDVARLNFSYGDHDSHHACIKNIRAVATSIGKAVPIIQDLSGPRINTKHTHHFDRKKSVLTKKDMSDLSFGISAGVDYVAQSYVGRAEDVECLRAEMNRRGVVIPIIAKIERQEAILNFDGILQEADAVMIARGDLGFAVPIEELPFLTKEFIEKAKRTGKTLITATEMLYSMTKSDRPTRAEVTDVAYAVLTGSDAVMLSEETAIGRYPVKAVEVMEKIVRRAEASSNNLVANLLTVRT